MEMCEVTDLRSSAFLRRDDAGGVRLIRRSISGLLFSNLASAKQPFIGILHPDPARPVDPAFLPQVEFGRGVVDRESNSLRIEWPKGFANEHDV